MRHHLVLRPGALRLALERERQAAEQRKDEREHVLGDGLGRERRGELVMMTGLATISGYSMLPTPAAGLWIQRRRRAACKLGRA